MSNVDLARTPGRLVGAFVAITFAVVGVVPGTAVPVWADDVRAGAWQLAELRVAEAHRVARGDGVVVAVVDSGVDPTHPDLAGAVLPGVDVLDGANRYQGQRDLVGHGTAVASLIAGRGHGPGGGDGVLGLAPNAMILPLKVDDPATGPATAETIARAIRIAVDRGAGVICIALGAFGVHFTIAEAVAYATDRGVLIVAAAGNPPAFTVNSPANIPEVVAAAGHDRDGNTVTPTLNASAGSIDIAAPAADIPIAGTGGTYQIGSGTSLAAAIVAGTLALIRAAQPQSSAADQLRRLLSTASDIGVRGEEPIFGRGEVNPVRALTTELSATATPGSSHTPAAAAQPRRSYRVQATCCLALAGLILLAVVIGRRAFRQ